MIDIVLQALLILARKWFDIMQQGEVSMHFSRKKSLTILFCTVWALQSSLSFAAPTVVQNDDADAAGPWVTPKKVSKGSKAKANAIGDARKKGYYGGGYYGGGGGGGDYGGGGGGGNDYTGNAQTNSNSKSKSHHSKKHPTHSESHHSKEHPTHSNRLATHSESERHAVNSKSHSDKHPSHSKRPETDSKSERHAGNTKSHSKDHKTPALNSRSESLDHFDAQSFTHAWTQSQSLSKSQSKSPSESPSNTQSLTKSESQSQSQSQTPSQSKSNSQSRSQSQSQSASQSCGSGSAHIANTIGFVLQEGPNSVWNACQTNLQNTAQYVGVLMLNFQAGLSAAGLGSYTAVQVNSGCGCQPDNTTAIGSSCNSEISVDTWSNPNAPSFNATLAQEVQGIFATAVEKTLETLTCPVPPHTQAIGSSNQGGGSGDGNDGWIAAPVIVGAAVVTGVVYAYNCGYFAEWGKYWSKSVSSETELVVRDTTIESGGTRFEVLEVEETSTRLSHWDRLLNSCGWNSKVTPITNY